MKKGKEAKTIGGWLIVWAVFMFIQAALMLLVLLLIPDITYKFASIIDLAITSYLLILFFKKSEKFISFVETILSIGIVLVFIALLLSITFFNAGRFFIYLVNLALIVSWLLYFKKSKRVKNTFVNEDKKSAKDGGVEIIASKNKKKK